MSDNVNWPFGKDCKTGTDRQVIGMKLLDYLAWAFGSGEIPKKLFLPPIPRGFVWKPKQIADLWDSLLRGMPIGCLMMSKMSTGQEGRAIGDQETKSVDENTEAMGLLDGQQRTLAMLLGWPEDKKYKQYCLWIDLGENGQAGSPFELRITTKTQPFGFQRFLHGRLSRHDRREARKQYDKSHSEHKEMRDYELFDIGKTRPWKGGKDADLCVPIKDVWQAFKDNRDDKVKFYEYFKPRFQLKVDEQMTKLNENRLASLYDSFKHLESIEVPLALIPDHISQPPKVDVGPALPNDAPAPMILLFERIGQNGTRLSSEDLLFSMIKQQWPKAHDLVEKIHCGKVGCLMSPTDYVMTAFRLGSSEIGIADNPRPNPNDFHRNLEKLLGKPLDKPLKPLRRYLQDNTLVPAFDFLYNTLEYRGDGDIGLPALMMPHLSRGLIQVLLRWIMLNSNKEVIEQSRGDVIAFALFWYLGVLNEDKASKKAFELVKEGAFPAVELYQTLLLDAPTEDDIGMALPLISKGRLKEILIGDESPTLRSKEGMFAKEKGTAGIIATVQERELYKRFCWLRKPLLLWLQRAYVHRKFGNESLSQFASLTDEDSVPYDYDHLCPQNHWGAHWRSITIPPEFGKFRDIRHDVGNCIGNLHVLDSSLNRSFGDDSLEKKLRSKEWNQVDSLLYHVTEDEKLWKTASPEIKDAQWQWDELRLHAFQSAVYRRASYLYSQYYDACKRILPQNANS